jgi:hypothetical protein
MIDAILMFLVDATFRIPGYLILRCFHRSDQLELQNDRTVYVGILFWAVVVLSVWFVWRVRGYTNPREFTQRTQFDAMTPGVVGFP